MIRDIPNDTEMFYIEFKETSDYVEKIKGCLTSENVQTSFHFVNMSDRLVEISFHVI